MKLKERGIVVQMLYWNNKQKGLQFLGSPMLNDVMAEGFEPSTACLEGRCSIQLIHCFTVHYTVKRSLTV